MFLFLDSNYRNALSYGGRQLGAVFPEAVQRNARSCGDRSATIYQITACLRPIPSTQRSAIVFGGFENFATGNRSTIQPHPLSELKDELSEYLQMIRDILGLYSLVSIYVLPPIYRSQPIWYSDAYEDLLPLFLSEVSHLDPVRVFVVPPIVVNDQDLDCEGVHMGPPALQRLLDLLLKSFRDGVFVNPADFPILENLGKLLCHLFKIEIFSLFFVILSFFA